jgi:nicotinamidase-related amidase
VTAHLVVVDVQRVFADHPGGWAAPGFAGIVPTVAALVRRFSPEVTFTRFVAPTNPAGTWRDYDARWPFALQPPDAELWDVVPELAPTGPTLDAPTFSKWGPEPATRTGPDGMVPAGVSTDCCVLSTAVAAADAGVPVRVVADACAGADDESHRAALHVLGLHAPLVEIVTSADLGVA